ncbi:5-oxoprolinase subunit PxpB [Undibacterium parvum]|uniref:5-oxoprolinase subunit PxpB n=1 Tax=Undibacterium parvum TaxID=401471 RepID=UPI001D1316BE|nr:5-oxoprolinase subunit PxpB [Undibacterium parvum]
MTALLSKPMSFYLLGENAAVIQGCAPASLICQRRLWSLAQQLRVLGGYREVVPGMNNLTLVFDPELTNGAAQLALLADLWDRSEAQDFTSRTVPIQVNYGGEFGPDLELVAAHAGLSPEQVIAAHTAAEYLVYFLGFQPGFAYLGGLPPALATPRRATPRLSVPAGSVGIGGAQTGIYPAASPGGWQLIGRSSLTLFDPELAQPSLLQPGDLVRFVSL